MKSLIYAVFLAGTLIPGALNAQETYSINQLSIPVDTGQHQTVDFLVMGHIYGQPGGDDNIDQNLLRALYYDSLHVNECDFVMLLGDNNRVNDELNLSNFQHHFLSKINIPVFNAVGNHDFVYINPKGTGRQSYNDNFTSKTYYSFSIKNSVYIVLDTEVQPDHANAQIPKEQVDFLKNIVSEKAWKNIFVFSHKDIWHFDNNNFKTEIEPVLQNAITSNSTDVYWFSGDLGSWIAPFYYKEEHNIKYFHTSLSDSKDDRILKVSNHEDSVEITVLKTTGEKDPTHYSAFTNDKYFRQPNAYMVMLKRKSTYLMLVIGTIFGGLVMFIASRKRRQ